ncbi:MAG: hypothetical protein M1832_002198 [Thelocarpon impressellum]|nr:MAG: hypothetical protein M1832_002198 [Thelocarpon impressellum]
MKLSCEDFKAGIEPDNVCALASAYRGQPCHIFAQDRSGSYNVCFFVELDPSPAESPPPAEPERWVVRFPLPSVHDAREKLSGEVATMKHVATHTDIPIPRVHGYALGNDESNNGVANPTRHPFIIMDFVQGVRWHSIDLPKLDAKKKERFYGIPRRRLPPLDETLQPDSTGLGRPLSLDVNDQAVEGLDPDLILDRTYRSTVDYSYALYRLLYNMFKKQRNGIYDENDARAKVVQVFALQHLPRILFGWVLPEHNNAPFVLMHGDLRPDNIIIDEDYNIRAVIDWEWSRTVPLQFFIPPTWITGYDAHVVAEIGYGPKINPPTIQEFFRLRHNKALLKLVAQKMEDLDWYRAELEVSNLADDKAAPHERPPTDPSSGQDRRGPGEPAHDAPKLAARHQGGRMMENAIVVTGAPVPV